MVGKIREEVDRRPLIHAINDGSLHVCLIFEGLAGCNPESVNLRLDPLKMHVDSWR